MRLDKLLAHLGYGTRTQVKDLIRSGVVLVDGVVSKDPGQAINPDLNKVVVDTEEVSYETQLYFVMNKPSGVVCATRDPRETTILDLMPDYASRELFPVGRLDKDTTGLLLITTDGELAHQMLAPKKHVAKVYEATVDQPLNESLIKAFAEGVVLSGEERCKPARLTIKDATHAEVTLVEGKYHQIKRMFAVFGLQVVALNRIKFGSLTLPNDLKRGEYRKIKRSDIQE